MVCLIIFDDNPREWKPLLNALQGYKIIRIDHASPVNTCIKLFNPKLVLLNLRLIHSSTWNIFNEIRIAYPDLPILTYVADGDDSRESIKEAIADILCSTPSSYLNDKTGLPQLISA